MISVVDECSRKSVKETKQYTHTHKHSQLAWDARMKREKIIVSIAIYLDRLSDKWMMVSQLFVFFVPASFPETDPVNVQNLNGRESPTILISDGLINRALSLFLL